MKSPVDKPHSIHSEASVPASAAVSVVASAAESEMEAQPPRKKLDLSTMSPPENVEEARLEEFTIDGICGVY